MEKERFSLLLLEPGEVYFEDFRCALVIKAIPPDKEDLNQQDGRLKLCSKSLVFEPRDTRKPILKIMLKNCSKLQLINDSKSAGSILKEKQLSHNGIVIECSQHVHMLENNIVSPYQFYYEPVRFELSLHYSGVTDCLARITQLQRASTLPLPEQNLMISAITFSRQSRCSFDKLWLGDLYEETVLETQSKKVTPLVMNPGRIILTASALYYQPFNNVETQPVTIIKLEHIRRVIKRRFLLQQLGVELYCNDKAPVPHLYLTFVTSQKRDELYDAICAQPAVKLEDDHQEAVILQWQHGVISNYDYLLYLNSVADRTFNDLTQYPVFPWVIADYSSSSLDLSSPSTFRDLAKPMGALNETRFRNLKERFDDMPEPKFLFGSHYSTPGFVLFYLVRKYPQYMLCLQNGRFDHPDRMFNSVADVWRNVLTSNTDFKELVPEFYDTKNKGDFLTNSFGINFGHRQNGTKVSDVELPPWASDTEDFVKKLREALESDHVSQNLHHWIDLIFGYKQRGDEAMKANNVFYHLCYEGSVDLEGETDDVKKHALEIQIMEFGQIPKQVFLRPHPKRFLLHPETPLSADGNADTSCDRLDSSSASGDCTDPCKQVFQYEQVGVLKCRRGAVTAVKYMEGGDELIATVGEDNMLRGYCLKDGQQAYSVPLGVADLNDVAVMPGSKRLAVASQNSSVYIYDLEFGRIVDEVVAHSGAVTCIAWSKDPKNGFMVTGSSDCAVVVWRGLTTGEPWQELNRNWNRNNLELEHGSSVVCLALSGNDSLLATGCEDGGVFVWSVGLAALEQTFEKHDGPVGGIAFSNESTSLATCGACDGVLKVFDLSSSVTVCAKELGEGLKSLFWMHSSIVLGTVAGNVFVWDVPHATLVQSFVAHQGATLCVALSANCHTLVTGGEDGRVGVWEKAVGN